MKSQRGKKAHKRIKQKWKNLRKIGSLYGLTHQQVSVVLQQQNFLGADENPTQIAFFQKMASYPYGFKSTTGLFWNCDLVSKLLSNLGYTIINPFLNEARSVAKNIRTAWNEGDCFASANQDRMAICSYEEGMWNFEHFYKKLPEQYKLEALCELSQCLMQYKPRMTRENVDIVFKNAKINLTMNDIDNHSITFQKQRIENSLNEITANKTDAEAVHKRKI